VVVAGLTLTEPLPEVDVNAPGVIAMLVAPDVTQLRALLEPELMPARLAENELIVGFEGVVTATVAVAVVEPDEFVAVSV
jgi:hypothetical protein